MPIKPTALREALTKYNINPVKCDQQSWRDCPLGNLAQATGLVLAARWSAVHCGERIQTWLGEKEIIDINNIDVFIDSWDDNDTADSKTSLLEMALSEYEDASADEQNDQA